jgi:hypothetical protein
MTAPNSATFAAAASTPVNCAPPTVQWYSEAPGSSSFSPISGATSASYTTLATTPAQSGTKYEAVFTNSFGSSTTGAALLTVKPPAAVTFGKTTVGASSDTFSAERKRVNRYALAEAGSVTKLSLYLAPRATSGQQVLKGVIYSDSSGKPEALLGVTEQLTFKRTNAAGWYALPLAAPVKLAAGTYWIGVITGATSQVAGLRYDSVPGARAWNANTFASGPTNPFGAVTADSERMSLYATYTPASPPPPRNETPPSITGTAQQGRTLTEVRGKWSNSPTGFTYQWLQCNSLGTGCLPISGATSQTYVPVAGDVGDVVKVQETARNEGGSGGPATSSPTAVVSSATFGKTTVGASSDIFAAERKRVNHYALPEAGSVTKLSVYLAPTGTSGQQVLKGVIYSDSRGKPEALLGVSEQRTFKSTNVAGWYELPFASPVKLAAGNYWIGVITGVTPGVAGWRFDRVTGGRAWNANAFASGPTNPFGAATIDSQQASLYATY